MDTHCRDFCEFLAVMEGLRLVCGGEGMVELREILAGKISHKSALLSFVTGSLVVN